MSEHQNLTDAILRGDRNESTRLTRAGIDATFCRLSGREPLKEEQNAIFRDQEAYTKRMADWKDWWAKQSK